ncbi:MAG: hypothetical protein P8P42_08880 [Gammaproteobacteria bacterium]|nr:hypothetical protein [Gammaproteobacteria bacterium]MDG2119396.1 hypothetical protein [Gammaproteobacteria bacterium]|tara:strand:+ start:1507 stop:2496 length:990 start_codon:yes stop_codon:yes gene_type:complete
MKTKLFAFPLILIVLNSLVYAENNYTAPRTHWDQPDLQGVWNFASNVPMSRPRQFGEREYMTQEEADAIAANMEASFEQLNEYDVGGYNTFWVENAGRGDNLRTSLITYPSNGQLPKRVEGINIQNPPFGGLGPDFRGERPVRTPVGGIGKNGPEDRGISERCIVGFNSGPPFVPSLYNNNVQIVQNKDTVVVVTEMIHDARIIPLTKSNHVEEEIRLWTGDSRGYWDGDTLVVETKNFNDLTQSFSVFGSATGKFLTERFTRVNEYTVDYEFTIEDPDTFTDRITARVPMSKVDGLMYEYACHEGNYGMVNILRGERMAEMREDSPEP